MRPIDCGRSAADWSVSSRHFRAGVVTVVERSDRMVCVFERADAPGSWQFPQGGIDEGEDADDAAWRELAEETGLQRPDVEFVGAGSGWIAYEWPPELRRRRAIGQVQRWYLFHTVDDAPEPRPDGDEFVAHRWVTREWILEHVIEFRRECYQLGLAALDREVSR